ncbi:hypothetical protein K7X08_021204 [Anisodus acutangulus]|uniref:Uncharacterized protein n=1 Tax=Anisodus acutangulus TaxID=402998 RepID=A0A9Q1R8V7_9SOLA|nr:hypothetical protein K7X08_021204 [Anisodus acutangulus]
MNPSRWIDLMHKSKKTSPSIMCDSKACLDHDVFAIMWGPTIAAISVLFDHAEHEDVYQTCIDGFLVKQRFQMCHHLEDVLDDLVVSLLMQLMTQASYDPRHGKPLPNSLSIAHLQSVGTPRRSSGLMGRFSQLLYIDTEEPRSQPTEQQLAAHQRTLQTIQKCQIDTIFTESKFLLADSLLRLARAFIWAAGRPRRVVVPPRMKIPRFSAWNC